MLKIYAMACGYLEFDRSLFFPDIEKGGRWTIPVPSYLICHPRGNVLFDTGVHCQAIHDPEGRLGFLAKIFAVRSQEDHEIVSQLARLGMRPDEIRYVVNSHFHFDHAGGNEFFPKATFLVQKKEMEGARDPEVAKKNGFDPKDFDHPLDYQLVDGEQDIFGDGRLILLPTHGHTPGHQSLRIRVSKDTELVLAGDACYTRENMDRNVLPRVAWQEEEMYRSLDLLRKLRDQKGAFLLYGHDPGQWQEIPHAPQALV